MDTVVELSDVTLFRRDVTILRGISWRVRRGEHWAVLGANGSGKTTLLSIVCGYLWPSRGEASVLGERFGATDLRELRKRIGWVSSALHDRVPVSHTALETVLTGRKAMIGLRDSHTPEDVARANDLLGSMGCSGSEDREYGLLSQGEQQKVLIARALMARPALLILDEVCAGLDIAAREEFLGTVGGMAEQPGGPTLILVTHHIEEIVPVFTHALLLREGAVVASGPRGLVLTEDRLSDALGLGLTLHGADGRMWPRIKRS